MAWLLLVTSLSGDHGALRLRFWRAMKALGAAVLRDGVYLAPARDGIRETLEEQAAEIQGSGGSAFVFEISEIPDHDNGAIAALFDRTTQYEKLNDAVDDFQRNLRRLTETEARRALRQMSREFALIDSTDFFPRDARELARAALAEAEKTFASRFSPEEPTAVHAVVQLLNVAEYQSRTWATRAHLWVDRVASAWLIKRFIDRRARFLWLEHATDCPSSAIGFDFDGARFTHVEERVTFEVLLRSFGLDSDVALARIGELVHQLDVGDGRVVEAAGFEAMLTGARERCADDDAFLAHVGRTLDDLYRAFSTASAARKEET